MNIFEYSRCPPNDQPTKTPDHPYVAPRVYAATCTSVDVSGVGELDGTYTWEYAGIVSASSPNPDHLYVRVEGTETFEIKGSGRLWWMANADDATLRYQVSPEEFCEAGVLCVAVAGFVMPGPRCYPLVSCGVNPEAPVFLAAVVNHTETCGRAQEDHLFEVCLHEAPSQSHSFAFDAGGAVSCVLVKQRDGWWVDFAVLLRVKMSQTYDNVDHPADITQDWAECEQYDCPEAAAVSQPVITCTGETKNKLNGWCRQSCA